MSLTYSNTQRLRDSFMVLDIFTTYWSVSIEFYFFCKNSASRGVRPKKLNHLAGYHINLCTSHFNDLFAKYRNSTKNAASGKKVVDGLQYTAVAIRL